MREDICNRIVKAILLQIIFMRIRSRKFGQIGFTSSSLVQTSHINGIHELLQRFRRPHLIIVSVKIFDTDPGVQFLRFDNVILAVSS